MEKSASYWWKIWDKLRDITKKDPCKEIDIPCVCLLHSATQLFTNPVSDIMEHKFRPKISWAEKQPEQEVGKPLRCSFDVAITWYITVLNEKVVVRIFCLYRLRLEGSASFMAYY